MQNKHVARMIPSSLSSRRRNISGPSRKKIYMYFFFSFSLVSAKDLGMTWGRCLSMTGGEQSEVKVRRHTKAHMGSVLLGMCPSGSKQEQQSAGKRISLYRVEELYAEVQVGLREPSKGVEYPRTSNSRNPSPPQGLKAVERPQWLLSAVRAGDLEEGVSSRSHAQRRARPWPELQRSRRDRLTTPSSEP